jgi:hypothetical protein
MVVAPEEILRLRAHRILTDGRKHSEQAVAWARAMLQVEALYQLAQAVMDERGVSRFSPRELSLGAQREWA